jgi:hypothetical protein
MKEVTAVNWLLDTLGYNENMGGGVQEIIEQAKEMEREQMIKFHKWMLETDTEQNADKYFHFTNSDMLNEYYKQD